MVCIPSVFACYVQLSLLETQDGFTLIDVQELWGNHSDVSAVASSGYDFAELLVDDTRSYAILQSNRIAFYDSFSFSGSDILEALRIDPWYYLHQNYGYYLTNPQREYRYTSYFADINLTEYESLNVVYSMTYDQLHEYVRTIIHPDITESEFSDILSQVYEFNPFIDNVPMEGGIMEIEEGFHTIIIPAPFDKLEVNFDGVTTLLLNEPVKCRLTCTQRNRLGVLTINQCCSGLTAVSIDSHAFICRKCVSPGCSPQELYMFNILDLFSVGQYTASQAISVLYDINNNK